MAWPSGTDHAVLCGSRLGRDLDRNPIAHKEFPGEECSKVDPSVVDSSVCVCITVELYAGLF